MSIELRNVGGGETGVCRILRYRDPTKGEVLHVNHADPTTMVTHQLLWDAWSEVRDGGVIDHPFVSLRRPEEGHGSRGHGPGEYDCSAPPGSPCFQNWLLTIKGDNRTVIYRIGEYDVETDCWRAAWPD
ncbi:hypothetical protein SEA_PHRAPPUCCINO_94 [Mycobacterium phage Phrappuccino]|uniref:Uncharacterized protein n=1 Tax=Mycobacterium phage Phrappuccino TaxID=2591223 RepID=A0A514DDS5_9CAUD|nr:hypothetical protein KHQ87_gp094 [Mycobacterium phage Phrappuccino]QDH91769.1 hypothetical protein SEA_PHRAPPUCCINO_94 [Mycobacterium phage Phrappuccino]QIQ63211.1 hypothetical protein SEA_SETTECANDELA_94 [Mycobacterium phage Settecandela]